MKNALWFLVALSLVGPATPPASAQLPGSDLVLPVASRSDGFNETRWRTRLWVIAGSEDAQLELEFYPTSIEGLDEPAATASMTVRAGTQVFLEDLLGDLYGVNGNGAVRILASSPVAAFARVVNIKMPAALEGGTFGQAMPAMSAQETLAAGVFPGLFSEPISDESGFRSNLGWFNPGPAPVQLTARVHTADGELLGERTLQVAPASQWLGSVFDVVWTVPQNRRELKHFMLSYETSGGPLYLFASVIDNITGDAVTILPRPQP